jgi:S-adenosylmethionine:diacylglycerol 3-amino-3-carboxypropyl transferase
MLSKHSKQVNNLLVTYRGEIITIRQAVAGGVVTAYMDSGTDDVVCVEINPACVIESKMRVMLSKP